MLKPTNEYATLQTLGMLMDSIYSIYVLIICSESDLDEVFDNFWQLKYKTLAWKKLIGSFPSQSLKKTVAQHCSVGASQLAQHRKIG